MDWTDLQEYVNANAADQDLLQSCLIEAQALVAKVNRTFDYESGTYGTSLAPDEVVDRAILECASELFHSRNAPNGVLQFAAFDGAPIRIARDPMNRARVLLAPWVVFGL